MNKTLETMGREKLKDMLSQCNEDEQHLFKRMYSHKNLDLSINDCVAQMDANQIDWALTQLENTLAKKGYGW